MRALEAAPVDSVEVKLRLAWAYVERGDGDRAGAELDALAAAAPADWRVDWYRGLAALAAGQSQDARRAFDAVYGALPGEPAPKVALAAAAEWTGDRDTAARLYERVWRADRGYVSAAFGLARLRLAGDATHLVEADLLDASGRLERLGLDVARQARLTIETLEAGLAWVTANGSAPPARPGARVLGYDLTERALRFGLERAYRVLAKVTHDRHIRTELVDQANAVRPRTLV